MNICEFCGRTNKQTTYNNEYKTVLCDSCRIMFKKHPMVYIPPVGEIHYDKDGNIICRVCGRSFKKLSLHLKTKHRMSTCEYKETFGLNRTSKLTGKNFIPNIIVDVTTVNHINRFEKGHTKSVNKTRRLQAFKNKEKKKLELMKIG